MSKKLKWTKDPEVFADCLAYGLKKNYNIPMCSIKVRTRLLADNGIATFDDLIAYKGDFSEIKGIGPKISHHLDEMREHEIWRRSYKYKLCRLKRFLKILIFGREAVNGQTA